MYYARDIERVLGLVAVAVFAVSFGCSGADFGGELTARPQPRPVGEAEGTTLRVPGDQPLNITLSRATREPGLNGVAQSTSAAKASGVAEAEARVDKGGTAEASFQLGHALENATQRQADFDYSITFSYEYSAESDAALPLADAAVGLRLYARKRNGRLLRELALVDYTTEGGPAQRRSDEQLDFTLTLGPEDAVDVYVAGRVRIEVPDDRSAVAKLRLTDFGMQVVSRPAPAIETGRN